ncbi:MAG: hypothetical protein PF961_03340 [Planctomycetota bacterium]|jgi:hypothetical protein|nr:hypothetical protein [Planctomycetota bacterium]
MSDDYWIIEGAKSNRSAHLRVAGADAPSAWLDQSTGRAPLGVIDDSGHGADIFVQDFGYLPFPVISPHFTERLRAIPLINSIFQVIFSDVIPADFELAIWRPLLRADPWDYSQAATSDWTFSSRGMLALAKAPSLSPTWLAELNERDRQVLLTVSEHTPLGGKIVMHARIAEQITAAIAEDELEGMKLYPLTDWQTNMVFEDEDLTLIFDN